MDQDFESLMQSFLRFQFNFNPLMAFKSGWREYGGKLPQVNKETISIYSRKLKRYKTQIGKFDKDSLSEVQRLDLLVMDNRIDSELFSIDEIRMFNTYPMIYGWMSGIHEYLLKEYAPLEERLEDLSGHLLSLELLYKDAIDNLDENLAPELIQMAVFMLQGNQEFIANLDEEIKHIKADFTPSPEIAEMLESSKERGLAAIQLLLEFLEKKQETATGSYKLGKKLFLKMLSANERVDLSIEEILIAGQKNLDHNLEEMNKAANAIDSSKSVEEIMDDYKT